MIALDTHMLVRIYTKTTTAAELALAMAAPQWGIAAIVLWELAMLERRGRLGFDLDAAQIARDLSLLHVWPLDLAVARQSTQLDFKSDPADELIAATSIVHRVPLLTRDAVIRGSQLVPLVGTR